MKIRDFFDIKNEKLHSYMGKPFYIRRATVLNIPLYIPGKTSIYIQIKEPDKFPVCKRITDSIGTIEFESIDDDFPEELKCLNLDDISKISFMHPRRKIISTTIEKINERMLDISRDNILYISSQGIEILNTQDGLQIDTLGYNYSDTIINGHLESIHELSLDEYRSAIKAIE